MQAVRCSFASPARGEGRRCIPWIVSRAESQWDTAPFGSSHRANATRSCCASIRPPAGSRTVRASPAGARSTALRSVSATSGRSDLPAERSIASTPARAGGVGSLLVGTNRAPRPYLMRGFVWVGLTVFRPRTLDTVTWLSCCSADSAEAAGGFGSAWSTDSPTGTVVRWGSGWEVAATVRVLAVAPDFAHRLGEPPGAGCLTSIAAGADNMWVTVASSDTYSCGSRGAGAETTPFWLGFEGSHAPGTFPERPSTRGTFHGIGAAVRSRGRRRHRAGTRPRCRPPPHVQRRERQLHGTHRSGGLRTRQARGEPWRLVVRGRKR